MNKHLKIIVLSAALILASGCGGSSDPKYPSKKVDNIKVTKKFFSKLRNDALVFVNFEDDNKEGSLEKEAKGFSKALEDVTLDVGSVSDDLSKLIDMIKNMSDRDNFVDGDYNLTRVSDGNYTYIIKPNNYKGNLVISDIENLTEDTNASINGTFSGNQNLNAKAIIKKLAMGYNMILNGRLSSSDANLTIQKLDYNQTDKTAYLNMLSLVGESNGYKIGGNLSTSDYVDNSNISENDGKIPSKLLYTGDIENIKSTAKIEGSIALGLKDATNFDPKADDKEIPKIDISGKLTMPSHPPLDVDISFDTSNDVSVLTFNYSYDDTTINSATSYALDTKNGNMELSSNDGIKVNMDIRAGKVVYGGKVTKDGELVGTIQDRQGVPVISYTDGTFESLY